MAIGLEDRVRRLAQEVELTELVRHARQGPLDRPAHRGLPVADHPQHRHAHRLGHLPQQGLEIHAALRERGVEIAERSVTNLLDRYDELLATSLTDTRRLRRVLKGQRGVILALDGLQPDVGHEVLWVVRDCLSGEVLLARSLLSGTAEDLAPVLRDVAAAVGVPVLGVVSDGQTSIRRAVERALPGVPHQLCQFHFLREAAHPIFEADRHAKVRLKAEVRGIRPIERALEGQDGPMAEVARGYCAAVRSAITDDGRPPLAASGLRLKARLEAVSDSLDRVVEKGAGRRRSRGCAS